MNARINLVKTKLDLLNLYENEKLLQDSLLFTQQVIKIKENSLASLEQDLIEEKKLNEVHEYNAWLLSTDLEDIKNMHKLH